MKEVDGTEMTKLKLVMTKAGRVVLQLLLPTFYRGPLRPDDSKVGQWARRLRPIPELDRQGWEEYKSGKVDSPS